MMPKRLFSYFYKSCGCHPIMYRRIRQLRATDVQADLVGRVGGNAYKERKNVSMN